MKTAIIHGQTHKGSTYHITKLLLDQIPNQEVSEFYVNDIPCCIGCFNCIVKGEEFCPHREKIFPIIQSIETCDLLIFDTPNYCMGMSGQLKTFFDHMGYRWMSHRPHPSMKNKIGIAISTTAGTGAAGTTKAIKQQMFWWGIPTIYQISVTVGALSWKDVAPSKKEKIRKKTAYIARKITKQHGKKKHEIKTRFIFEIMRAMQKKASWNPLDQSYWKKNGWI